MGKLVSVETEVRKINDKGETTSIEVTEQSKRVKYSSEDVFIKVFCDDIMKLQGIQKISGFKVLLALIKYKTDYDTKGNNAIYLGHGIAGYICRNYGIHKPTYYEGIKELEEKHIILKHSDYDDKKSKFYRCYQWNPFILGQGSFVDIKILRQQITREYDFENLIVTTKNEAITLNENGVDIMQNPHKYEIESATKDGNNSDIVVRKKSNDLNLHD